MSRVTGVRFHPTDVQLINHLKRFFKRELCFSQQCHIQFADIFGDQPPWEIFGADSEEKVGYFITPLKKRKSEHIRFSRTCATGTWKSQTGEYPIRINPNGRGAIVGFKRSFTFVTKECGQNKIWLMKEYYLTDDFFRENNHIPKEDFVLCRIKKKTNKEQQQVNDAVEVQDGDVEGIFDAMLLRTNHNDYCTTEDHQVSEEDQWESIIDEVCDEDQNNTTMEKKDNTTSEQEEIAQLQQGEEADYDIKIWEDILVDIPEDWLQQDI